MNILEQIPESIKVTVATSAPVLSFMGMPIQTWSWILSIIVALMVMVEKFPLMLERAKQLKEWFNETFRKQSK